MLLGDGYAWNRLSHYDDEATISYKSEQAVHLRDFERSNAQVAHERRHRNKVWERK